MATKADYLALQNNYKILEKKYLEVQVKLDLLAEKIEPIVKDYYSKNQPRTPRGRVGPIYQNKHTPGTHGYFIVKAVFDSYPEGIDEFELKEKVKVEMVKIGKAINNSSFSRCLNDSIRKEYISKDNDGIYHYV